MSNKADYNDDWRSKGEGENPIKIPSYNDGTAYLFFYMDNITFIVTHFFSNIPNNQEDFYIGYIYIRGLA